MSPLQLAAAVERCLPLARERKQRAHSPIRRAPAGERSQCVTVSLDAEEFAVDPARMNKMFVPVADERAPSL